MIVERIPGYNYFECSMKGCMAGSDRKSVICKKRLGGTSGSRCSKYSAESCKQNVYAKEQVMI